MTNLDAIHAELGITTEHLALNKLGACKEPDLRELEVVEIDFEGKPFLLLKPAAAAWREMRKAAEIERVRLRPFSGFRSVLYQRDLIRRHLQRGRDLSAILTHIAIPGFSEHHSGRAVDIHAEGHPVLEESFEKTPEFDWLARNAGGFGFQLSYPRNNPWGIIYEPWHWYFTGR